MDRQIVYPGSIPLDSDLLNVQRETMKAIGALAQATLGIGPVFCGLACLPTAPASLSIQVAPGSLLQASQVDASAFGSLAADPTPLVKMGLNLGPTTLALSPPAAAGTSVVYLIEAQLAEIDTTPVVLPYYNAANPNLPFMGPAGSGTSQPTQRLQQVVLQATAGSAAPTGSALGPAANSGWVGLATVTVDAATTQITADRIVGLPAAPQVPFALPQLRPGFATTVVITAGQLWTVPDGVWVLKVRVVGGGGGGGGGGLGFGGGGGGAGGYAEGVFQVVPGTSYWVAVGQGGAGSPPYWMAAYGGTSSFGSLCSATGGGGGGSDPANAAGGPGGMGYGGLLDLGGGCGQDGQGVGLTFAACGGASAFGGGGRGAAGASSVTNATAPGAGGGGCYAVVGNGGNGASGVVIIEY